VERRWLRLNTDHYRRIPEADDRIASKLELPERDEEDHGVIGES
jgi:hypothetical protein